MSENRWWIATRQALAKPTFVIVTLLLLGSAVGLDAIRKGLNLYFRKEAVPLRMLDKGGLAAIPDVLPPAPAKPNWVQVPEPDAIDLEMSHNLGTDKYVFREYVDVQARPIETAQKRRGDPTLSSTSPITSKEKIDGLRDTDKSMKDKRREHVAVVRGANPRAVVNLAITYYTGKVDTVPHVPDRCYVADGFRPQLTEAMVCEIKDVGGDVKTKIPLRFIVFVDQTSAPNTYRPDTVDRCVAYFFHVNGKLIADHIDVRAQLQDLRERYAYFAKIEMMMTLPRIVKDSAGPTQLDKEQVQEAMRSFLRASWPEIEKVLPDWDKYRQMR